MDYWGGPKGMLAPPPKLLGAKGYVGPPPKLLGGLAPLGPPTSSYAYVIVKLGPLTQRSFSLNHHSIKYILPSLSTSFCFLRGLLDVSHFLAYTIVTPFPIEIPPKAFFFFIATLGSPLRPFGILIFISFIKGHM